MTDEEKAVETAAQALGLMKRYWYRVAFTTRAYANEELEASSVEAAIARLREINVADEYGHYNDSGVEGDETITLMDEDGDELAELDMRATGQPFSWTACDLVVEMCKTIAEGGDLNAHADNILLACANTNPVVRYEDNE